MKCFYWIVLQKVLTRHTEQEPKKAILCDFLSEFRKVATAMQQIIVVLYAQTFTILLLEAVREHFKSNRHQTHQSALYFQP